MKKKTKIIIAVAAGLVLALLCVAMAATHILIRQQFGRAEYPVYETVDYWYKDYQEDYARTPVSFMSGENRLQGYIYGAENDKGLIVLAHGIGSGHESYINQIILFVDNGWRVFAYDATGTCESEGDGTVGLVQSALDLDAALSFAEHDGRLSGLPVCLYGHSWGGYAVAAVLNFGHRIEAVASVSGYAYPVEMMLEFAQSSMSPASKLLYPFIWLDTRLTFGKNSSLSAIVGINSTEARVLVVHGVSDTVIGFDNSSIISKKDEITNPNVRYLVMDKDKQDGHTIIFRDIAAVNYLDECDRGLEALAEQYGGSIPDDVRNAYIKTLDKELANRLNSELFDEVLSFFDEAVPVSD